MNEGIPLLVEMSRTIDGFAAKLDALFTGTPGTKTLVVPFGHIAGASIHDIVATPWRHGGLLPPDRDPNSQFSIALRQHPTAVIRAESELLVLGSADSILPPDDASVIPFTYVAGSDEYLKPVDMAIKAYWADVGKDPAWYGIVDLTVTVVLTRLIALPEEEAAQEDPFDVTSLSEYRGR